MPLERNILLEIAYEGTQFHGWQSQPGLRTVQAVLESATGRLLGHPVHATGASRTDAGVHARRQAVGLRTTSPIPASNLVLALNHRLPPDIGVVSARDVAPDFHASRHALGKLYRYTLFHSANRPVTAQRQFATWHYWLPLEQDRLRAAARLLVGTHDFAGFASQGSPRATTVRTVRHVAIRKRREEVRIDVIGDGFLYNQVRNMVGTLLEIGRGHWPVERIREVLASRDRRLAGPTAPALGLCLQWVRYPPSPPAPSALADSIGQDARPPPGAGD